MREIDMCAGGYPYVKHDGPAKVACVIVTPKTIASDCYCELVDSATNTQSTSWDSTAPRNLENPEPCRKPFRARIHADIGTQVFNFDNPLKFDEGVQIGYAENCWVRIYVA